MGLLVNLLQPLDAGVRVDLRGAQARMSQQLLNRPKVGAGVQQVRGKGVAERVDPQLVSSDGGEHGVPPALIGARAPPPAGAGRISATAGAAGPRHVLL